MSAQSNIVDRLTAALPQGRVVRFNQEFHEMVTHDASSAIGGTPSCLVYPETMEEVQQCLLIANQARVPIFPRGAGTGKTGGAVPSEGSIVMGMEKFDKILEIDVQNRMAVVEPGVILKTFQNEVESYGLFYPPDPASLYDCTLGGNVVINAGGPRCLKYGVTGQYVAGLEGVWADGTCFKLGGKLYKNVSGYDLMRVLIGSEGTLGIITKITLKLLTKPKVQADCHAVFPTVEAALLALRYVQESGVQPAVAELMDSLCIQAVQGYLQKTIPQSEFPHCLFQLDAQDEIALKADSEVFLQQLHKAGAISVQYGAGQNDEVWEIRRSISSALTAFSANKESHDITVPISTLSDTMAFLNSLNTDPAIAVLGYGHMGDGNLHVNILNRGLSLEKWEAVKSELEYKIFDYAVKQGGTISGEHGIGITKKLFMPLMYDRHHLEKLVRIKALFDPNHILNPYKIIG